jgi:hypothetical protein
VFCQQNYNEIWELYLNKEREEEIEINHEFTNNREWTSDARHQTSAEKGEK